MKTSTKLMSLVVTALVGVVAIAGIALYSLNTSLLDSRRSEVITLLKKAEHIIQYYRDQQAKGSMTQEAAQAGAIQALVQTNPDLSGLPIAVASTSSIRTRTSLARSCPAIKPPAA